MMKIKKYIIYMVVVCIGLICVGCTKRVPVSRETAEETTEQTEKEMASFVGVIQAFDQLQNYMTLVDVRTGSVNTLKYHGGVEVTNKYGELMAISQLQIGEILDVVYDVKQEKLVTLHMNESAMRYEDMHGLQIDANNKKAKLAGMSLDFTDQLVVADGTKLMGATALTDQDLVDLWVLDGTLWAVSVKQGHGYLRFKNYETYLDGMIEVGDVVVPVTENMLLTVREGEYELRITKGEHSGTRYVTVTKDVETSVDLAALQIVPDPTGAVVIAVKPEGMNPRIYIDGMKYEPDTEIELVYGKHILRVYADGYDKYSTYLEVKQAYKKYEINLQQDTTETSSSEENTSNASTESTTENESSNPTITVTAPVGVKLYVDGKYVGETPCSFTKKPGSHIITLTREGCVAATYTITAKDDEKDETYSYDPLVVFGSELDDLQ